MRHPPPLRLLSINLMRPILIRLNLHTETSLPLLSASRGESDDSGCVAITFSLPCNPSCSASEHACLADTKSPREMLFIEMDSGSIKARVLSPALLDVCTILCSNVYGRANTICPFSKLPSRARQ
jgi:hypothetical protein